MNKHTPGPWEVNALGAVRGGGFFIAEVLHAASCEQGQANAFLIAAAPELLKALERLVKVCEQSDIYPHVRGHVALARDAISRATGERDTKGNEIHE